MSKLTLLEINEEGRAIAWEGDLNAMMREAFHIIAERIEACATPEEAMKKLIQHLDVDKCESFTYAFTIEEVSA